MTDIWEPKDTTTHQDHVIAHVIGATVLGYFILDEVLYILLDIGFIWAIFLDGQMALLPHPVAVGELDIDSQFKEDLQTDVGVLLSNNPSAEKLLRIEALPVSCELTEVSFSKKDSLRRLILTGEESNLAIVASLATREIKVDEY